MSVTPTLSQGDVTICICTRRRFDTLAALLSSIEGQTAIAAVREVVVVDNDEGASAEALVRESSRKLAPLPVLYSHLSHRNVALARNTAVALASGEWLAFVDDDEIPDREWLEHLRVTATRSQADCVLGPVLPVFPLSTASWVSRSRVYRRRRFPTGAIVPADECRTGNALVARNALHLDEPWFSEKYGRTGGEDTEFFERVRRHGGRIVWCDEAVVHEVIEEERLSVRAMLLRGVAGGQSYGMRAIVTGGPGSAAKVVLRAILGGLACVCCALIWLPVDRAQSLHWGVKLAGHAGKILIVAGVLYDRFGDRWTYSCRR